MVSMQFSRIVPTLRNLRLGVRQRVVLVLLGGLIISLGISGWVILREQTQQINKKITTNSKQLAMILSRSLTNHIINYDYHTIQLFIEDIIKSPQISYIKVLSGRGNVMAEIHDTISDDVVQRYFEEPIMLNDKVIGTLVIGLDTTAIVAQIESQKSKLVLRELEVIAFILVLELIALSYLIVRPLSIISKTLQNNTNSEGVLPEAIPLDQNDEFGDIAKQYNVMREKLNEAALALQGKYATTDAKLREANVHLLNKSYELEKVNEILKKQTTTDPLTGLPNRREFQDVMGRQLPALIGRGERLAALLIDIDHFKNINDMHGHIAGDIVLRDVAARLESNLRKTDRIFRIGGEEFFVLCHEASEENARAIGEKLRLCIHNIPIIANNISIHVSVSIGIAAINGDQLASGMSYQEQTSLLYRQTDAALYFSKATGRNCVSLFSNLPHEQRQKLTG